MINKENPSKKYLEHLEYYKKMHEDGFSYKNGKFLKSSQTYNGQMTIAYAKFIKNIIKKNNLNSLLEYGCGKAIFYEKEFKVKNENFPPLKKYWGVDIKLFDPAVKEFRIMPSSMCDITICIDVLEHIPEEDIDWVLEKIMTLSKKFIFLVIGSYSSQAVLPNGEGAHILIKTTKWWFNKLVYFKKKFKEVKILCICIGKDEDNNLTFAPIEIDDKIKNYISK